MICNATYIRAHFRAENSVADNAINDAISDTESMLSQMVGVDNYATLDADAQTQNPSAAIVGGMITDGGTPPQLLLLFNGFLFFIGCGVVARLMHTQDIVVTSFGTVRKRDEYSEHSDAFDFGKNFENMFRSGVAQYCAAVGWQYTVPNTSTYYTTKFFDRTKGGVR